MAYVYAITDTYAYPSTDVYTLAHVYPLADTDSYTHVGPDS